MPSAPQILPTQIQQGTAPGVNYRLEGELVPVLHMALDGQVPVYFEHHVLLWKYPNMQVGLHPLKKGLKRRVFRRPMWIRFSPHWPLFSNRSGLPTCGVQC